MAAQSVEASLPIESVEVRPSRSLAVHRRDGSSGLRLFFVHGSCASMLQFEAMISHFASLGHEVIAYDFMGCGRSPKPRDWYAYDFGELSADLAAFLDKYGGATKKKKKNVLICHSAGCSLGLGIASQPSNPVDGLCLLGAPSAYAVHNLFYLPVFVLNWLQPTLSAGFEGLALSQKTRDGATDVRRQVLALAKDVNGANPMHMCKAYYRQVRLPSDDDVRAAGARVPVVLLSGADDMLVPPSASEALKALLPAETQMYIVPDASHQLMQEDPPAVCALVDAFLKANGLK